MDEDIIKRGVSDVIKYDVLQEILFNLEYEHTFGGLSPNEEKVRHKDFESNSPKFSF